MRPFSICTAFVTLVALVAGKKQTAQVSVRNNWDQPLVGVSVIHKYSDDYKNHGEWGIIKPGELAPETMDVEYNTGFLTTGRDWWVITWYSADMKTQYYSDPVNFRNIIDALEKVAPSVVKVAMKTVAAGMAAEAGPGAVVAAKNAAKVLAKVANEALFNTESTDGFKQHILRSEDAGKLTEIVINKDRSITFKSKSGNSDTGTSSRKV
ncbi:hypothetical protein BGZ60DRAFT_404871 [Tricladium varicosporioides]|nr:hypothetical protein BGZ60DRAFT_404871 [Hymenoscyphus varicosporioides]